MEIRLDPDKDSVENLKLVSKILEAKVIDRGSYRKIGKRGIMEALDSVLREQEERFGKTIIVDNVMEEMKKKRFGVEGVEKALEELLSMGKIIEPRAGFIQRVEDESY